ncbi:interleukin 21 receptor, tandem duplicate 1, partial [Menidia menidia]
MATGPASILLLWCLLAPTAVTSDPWCQVSCTTDYSQSLNCSCAATPPNAVRLSVRCRDEDGLEVGGSCTVRPPRSWCLMLPPRLEEVTLVGTLCWGAAGPEGGGAWDSPGGGGGSGTPPQEGWTPPQEGWILSDVVRPQPPADVRVENAGDAFNISWNRSAEYKLTYRLRIHRLQKPPHLLEVEEEGLRISHTALPPHQGFLVEVQAKPRQGEFLEGSWSEWSPAAEWRPPEGPPTDMNAFWVYISLAVVLVLGLLLLGYLQKPFFRRLKVVTYCPRPDGFFRPLYQSHAGDFKDWVKPAFSEADFLRVDAGLAAPVLHWDGEGGRSLGEAPPPKTGTPPPPPFSITPSPPATPSTAEGRVSIHTVTLSGDDPELEPMMMRMMAAGADPEADAAIAVAVAGGDGPERASLDSFGSSSGSSEDGYPHVDLDTIDSGFGEPRSPGVQTGNGY